MKINWNKELLEEIVLKSKSQKEVLRELKIRTEGGNFKTLRKYLSLYNISTEHFIKNYDKMVLLKNLTRIDTKEILVENSNFSRHSLKKRLFEEGYLENKCSLCGQGENWNNMKISLILDHINGIHNDNRLENLRIVCPNCNAGLETFAGKNNIKVNPDKTCKCGNTKHKTSIACNKCNGLEKRKIQRPDKEQLLKEIDELGYSVTGRKYGVSDNAIRKWIKNYEKINI